MAFLLISALLTDAILGEFNILWRHIGHPVTWMAYLLLFGEGLFNKPEGGERGQFFFGAVWFIFCLIFFTGLTIMGQKITYDLLPPPWGDILIILVASIFLATRSLFDHVNAVQEALLSGDLIAARQNVSMIVGRETGALDLADISRASIESLAENFSDGVIAPAFWFLVAGLPGIVAYKMTNTADSIIGHRTKRFNNFGYTAAKFDDLLNFIPARLTALLLILGSLLSGQGQARHGLTMGWRDRSLHASPNAGWPEATMAGLLGIRLGGPRHYADGKYKDNAWLGDGRVGDITGLAPALTITKHAFIVGCCLLLMGGLLWT